MNTHRPPIAIRISPGSLRPSSASDSGAANGRAISAPTVVVTSRKTDAVATISSRRSRSSDV